MAALLAVVYQLHTALDELSGAQDTCSKRDSKSKTDCIDQFPFFFPFLSWIVYLFVCSLKQQQMQY